MKQLFSLMSISVAILLGCGASTEKLGSIRAKSGVVKMRHQILFRSGDSEHVFEGYMLLGSDAFLVKAFAGPGVDLFTVVRNGEDQREDLHIAELADRIDVKAIGEEIARIYLGGCPARSSGEEAGCELFGQRMTEAYGPDGRLLERRFPDAHGVGLVVRYEDYRVLSGRSVPKRIVLSWGKGDNRMEISLAGLETVEAVDPDIFKVR